MDLVQPLCTRNIPNVEVVTWACWGSKLGFPAHDEGKLWGEGVSLSIGRWATADRNLPQAFPAGPGPSVGVFVDGCQGESASHPVSLLS